MSGMMMAVCAFGDTTTPVSYVGQFLVNGSSVNLAAKGVQIGDTLIATNNNASLSTGGSWLSAGGGRHYRQLSASDVTASFTGGYTLIQIYRGTIGSAVVVSSKAGGTLGQMTAPGFVKHGKHAGFAILGEIFVSGFAPTFSAPSGILQRASYDDPTNGTNGTTTWGYDRLSPPNAPYVDSTQFLSDWAVEDDSGGVPGNSQNHGGDFDVIEFWKP